MNFDPSGDNRETQNAMSSVRRPDTRNLDMLAAVAVARQNRIKEGDNETAEIREYMATLPFRGISRIKWHVTFPVISFSASYL